jgi:hypothetical protein
MGRVAGGRRCALAALLLALAGLTACSDDHPRNLVAAGEEAEAVGEPNPTTTTSTGVTTSTTSVITTTPPAPPSTAAPAPAVRQAPTPPRPAPQQEPGAEPWGYGDYGGSKTVRSGATTLTLTLYPIEAYAGQETQVRAEVQFVGGVTAFRIDFGDGTFVDGYPYPAWLCDGNMGSKMTSAADAQHLYAQPGRYTVTAVVTTGDCGPTPTVPGVPVATFPPHIYPRPVSGVAQTTTVSMTAIALPDRVPAPGPAPVIADCPPQAGGC